MIHYTSNRWCVSVYLLSLTFHLQALRGAAAISLGAAMIALCLSICDDFVELNLVGNVLFISTTVYTTLSSFVGILVVFRTSHAYARHWEQWNDRGDLGGVPLRHSTFPSCEVLGWIYFAASDVW